MDKCDVLPPGVVLPPMVKGEPAMPAGQGTPNESVLPRRVSAQTRPPRKSSSRGGPAGNHAGQPDRFGVLNAFVDSDMRSVSDKACKAWLALYRDTKPDGLARAAYTDLARRMGCGVSTAKRAVAELLKRRFVELVERGGKGRGPNTYLVRASAGRPRPGVVPEPDLRITADPRAVAAAAPNRVSPVGR